MRATPIIPILLILLPVLEVLCLAKVGKRIGAPLLLLYLASTFVAGSVLCRRSGWLTARRVAGVLLMVPGFLSDLVALCILVPPVRKWLLSGLARWAQVRMGGNGFPFPGGTYGEGGAKGGGASRGEGRHDTGPVRKETAIKDAEFRILERNGSDEQE